MEFDDILVRLGEFGRVQAILYLLLGIVGIPCGMQNLAMVFLGAKMDHWCLIPELSHLGREQMQNISAAVESDGALSVCKVVDLNYSQYDNQTIVNWNRETVLATTNDTRECDHWIYDQSQFKSTLRSQWNLVCEDNYIVPLMQTIYMCGFLIGTTSFGILSDRIGRLKTIMLSCSLMVTMAVLAAVTSVYWHFVPFIILRFFVGMSTAGFFTVTFVLIMEVIAPKWRAHTGLFFQGFFAAGFCILPGIAYALRDLLSIQLAAALPAVLLLSYYWIIPESPRWLIQQGRYSEAEKILKRIGKLNNRPLPNDFSAEQIGQDESKKMMTTNSKHNDHRKSLLDVLKQKCMRFRMLVCAYCWFVCGITYYGLSYSAEELGGDIFLNTLISGLVEYPAYIACFFFTGHPKIGRKYSLVLSFMIGGVCLITCVPLLGDKQGFHTVLLVIANIGKLGVSAAFAIVYIFTAEIFPTVTRSACVGACSMCARIGALLAPQAMLLKELWYGSSYMAFGLMAILAGILTLLLPESVNQILPETIEDGELFGLKAYTSKHHLHVTVVDDNDVKVDAGITLLEQVQGENNFE